MTVNAITDTKKGRTGIAPAYLHTTPEAKNSGYKLTETSRISVVRDVAD